MGPSEQEKQESRELSALERRIAESQEARSSELYGLTVPWLKRAGKFFEDRASGDPDVLFRSIAPGAESIIGESEAAKERILSSAPRGGEQRLALEMTDVGKGGQIGNLVTRSYLAAFPALASLAQGGIGFSINQIANAIAAGGQAGQITGNVMEADASGKGATMGFLGDLVGAAGSFAGQKWGGGGKTSGCWIAAACYGDTDWRTSVLRQWLNFEWANTSVLGALVMAVYARFGRRVAMVVRHNRMLRMAFRALFGLAFKRMRRDGWL